MYMVNVHPLVVCVVQIKDYRGAFNNDVAIVVGPVFVFCLT